MLRLWGAVGDLWLDEIKTLQILEQRQSPADIIWGRGQTNNHLLYSLYLHLVGPDAPVLILRAFSVVAGVLSVVFAGLLALRQNRLTALITMLLFALSYTLVLYGSEARGYGPMVLFLLIGLFLIEGSMEERPSLKLKLLLAVVLLAGFMSQLLFVLPLACFGLWVFIESLRSDRHLYPALKRTLSLFFWVAIAIGAFAVSLSLSWRGEGLQMDFWPPARDPVNLVRTFGELAQATLGVPRGIPLTWVVVIVTILTLVLLWLARDSIPPVLLRRRWFYLLHLIGIPLLLFGLKLYWIDFPRWVLVVAVAHLLLLGQLLGSLAVRGGIQRLVAILVVGLFTVGSGIQLSRFYEFQRGSYIDTLGHIVAASEPGTIQVGTWFGYEARVVSYYSKRNPLLRRIRHTGLSQAPGWVLFHPHRPRFAFGPQDAAPCPKMVLKSIDDMPPGRSNEYWAFAKCPRLFYVSGAPPDLNMEYVLSGSSPHWGLSGWNWHVYRRRVGD